MKEVCGLVFTGAEVQVKDREGLFQYKVLGLGQYDDTVPNHTNRIQTNPMSIGSEERTCEAITTKLVQRVNTLNH